VRVWHLGIAMAARPLNMDLSKAEIDLAHGRIIIPAANGVRHVVPVDEEGRILIDWSIRVNDSRLTQKAFEALVADDIERQLGTNRAPRFKDKLVFIGSIATGNELSDRGATPLDKATFLTSNHWNVANSILTGRFIREASLPLSLLVIVLSGAVAAWITIRFPKLAASVAILAAGALYSMAACLLFIQG